MLYIQGCVYAANYMPKLERIIMHLYPEMHGCFYGMVEQFNFGLGISCPRKGGRSLMPGDVFRGCDAPARGADELEQQAPPSPARVARQLEMVDGLSRVLEKEEAMAKRSSVMLAREAVELVLTSHWAHDPHFTSFLARDEFLPPGRRRAPALQSGRPQG
uniref:Uncharacterized protein n=1 Tax=Oryza brachyantha TaxID=4533 RepID=J3L096_ORYBR